MYFLVILIIMILGFILYLIKNLKDGNLENNNNCVLAQSKEDKSTLLIFVMLVILSVLLFLGSKL